MTQVKAKFCWVKIGPRKLMRVAELVRGQNAPKALALLRLMPQKGARVLEKLIKSALANAKNNFKLNQEDLSITECFVNQGVVMKRFQPRAKGRAFPIKKRTSHVTVYLSQRTTGKAREKEAKK